MKGKITFPQDKFTELYRKAEEILLQNKNKKTMHYTVLQKVLHELEVNQIELAMQNEELLCTKNELEDSRDKYASLFEFAPVGYFTVDKNNKILEANLTSAAILGTERRELINKPITNFIFNEDQDIYYFFMKHFFADGLKNTCELRMVKSKTTPFYVTLETSSLKLVEKKTVLYRICIIDISEKKAAEEEVKKYQKHLEDLVGEKTAQLNKANEKLTKEVIVLKKTEKALRESEDRYRDLVENSFDFICTHDLNGNILSSNRVASKKLGYNHVKLMKMNIKDLIAPEYKNDFDLYLKEIRKKGVASGLMKVKTKTGEKRIWEFNNSLRTIGVDKPVIRGTAHDITEHIRAERLLKESEERFRSIYENNTIGIYRTTPDGKILLANPALVSMLGYSSFKELEKRDLTKQGFEPKYKRQSFIRKIEKDREIIGLESAWIRKDGTIIFIRESAKAIRGPNGKTMYYDGTVEDITERRLTEKSLMESEELFKKVFRSIPGLVGLWQRNEKNEIILLMANENSYIESKGKIGKFIGMEVNEFFADNPVFAKYIIGAMSSGKQYHDITKIKLKTSGKTKHFYQNFVRVTENLVLYSALDVTERENAREELQKYKEELHSLLKRLETIREEERIEISRTIHDDLGQSLTALKIDLAWLKKEAKECDISVYEKIDIMSNMIDSTVKTIQNLSAELRPGILDDLGLYAAIEWLTDEIHKRTDIKFNLTITPEDISLNKNLSINIFRIIQETLTNIVRHSKATRVKIKLELTGNVVNIVIKDNGVGIPLKKIHDSNSLGLIGLRERARFWNGIVDIKGVKNKGTVVSVKLQTN